MKWETGKVKSEIDKVRELTKTSEDGSLNDISNLPVKYHALLHFQANTEILTWTLRLH